jgi:hypothetical protein
MPAKSEKQRKFMQAVANSPSFAKKAGVPQSVGREYSKAKGGDMVESKGAKSMMNRGRGRPGPMIAGRGAGKDRPAMAAMNKGGKMKKYAAGGLTSGHKAADGIAKKGKTKGKMVAMAKGGRSC